MSVFSEKKVLAPDEKKAAPCLYRRLVGKDKLWQCEGAYNYVPIRRLELTSVFHANPKTLTFSQKLSDAWLRVTSAELWCQTPNILHDLRRGLVSLVANPAN